MCSVLLKTALSAVAVTALAIPATASATNYVPCRSPGSGDIALRDKPRRCTLGGRIHFQQAPLIKLRWRSWGGSTAYARGRFIYNMGFNRAARVKLYQRQRWDEDAYVFRRARVCVRGRGCRSMRLPLN
jgi:hypothetical protein